MALSLTKNIETNNDHDYLFICKLYNKDKGIENVLININKNALAKILNFQSENFINKAIDDISILGRHTVKTVQ